MLHLFVRYKCKDDSVDFSSTFVFSKSLPIIWASTDSADSVEPEKCSSASLSWYLFNNSKSLILLHCLISTSWRYLQISRRFCCHNGDIQFLKERKRVCCQVTLLIFLPHYPLLALINYAYLMSAPALTRRLQQRAKHPQPFELELFATSIFLLQYLIFIIQFFSGFVCTKICIVL